MFEAVRDPDLEWLMIDSTVIRARHHAAGMNGGADDQDLGRSRGGFGAKVHLAVDALGLPLEIVLSPGQDADITHAPALLGDHEPGAVLGDKGYDSDAFAEAVEARGAAVVIPPRSNRKTPRECPRSGTRSSGASTGWSSSGGWRRGPRRPRGTSWGWCCSPRSRSG